MPTVSERHTIIQGLLHAADEEVAYFSAMVLDGEAVSVRDQDRLWSCDSSQFGSDSSSSSSCLSSSSSSSEGFMSVDDANTDEERTITMGGWWWRGSGALKLSEWRRGE